MIMAVLWAKGKASNRETKHLAMEALDVARERRKVR
jgi:hypothetical protein